MAKVDWSKARTILARVLDAPEEQQEHLLQQACAGDAQLLAGLRELLAQERDATGSLEPPVAVIEGGRVAAGQRIGPWRLERLIGTGGMGAVWLAARADGSYEQQVALKITRTGFGTADLVARLERERAMLARLEHTGIARIIDGGTTDDGAPYFVLEYVDGRRIDEFCDAARLTVRERIVLFVRVLQAVEYAHERGLVHRDLKPANLLVTADGDPKLLDFGIAKLVEEDTAMALTGTGERMMTPRYASPEQVSGGAVTTAVDIYALGVLLFELLTGAWPYSTDVSSIVGVQLAICQEPARRASKAVGARDTTRVTADAGAPSTAAAAGGTGGAAGPGPDRAAVAALRGTTAVELERALAGDLDWVLAKALAKEPERRYPSARVFAEDLQRFLAGYPVLARPDSRLYRTRKFVRRNRTLVAATAFVVLSLAAALVYSLRQNRLAVAAAADSAREAERATAAVADARARLEQVRQTGRELVFRLAGEIALLPGSGPAQLQMVEQGLEYLDAQEPDAQREPALALEVAAGFLMMADILSSRGRVSLARPEDAARAIRKSLVLCDSVLAAEPGNQAAVTGKVSALRRMSDVRAAQRRLPEARELARSALEVAEPHLEAADAELRRAASTAVLALAWLEHHTGSPEQALVSLERSAQLVRGLPGEGEDSADYHQVQGAILRSLGDHAGAVEAFEAGLELLLVVQEQRPDDARVRADVSSARATLGRALLDAGRVAEARTILEQSIDVQRRLLEVDRTNRTTTSQLLELLKALGQASLRAGDPPRASEHWEEALVTCTEGLARWPGDEGLQAERIVLLGLLTQGQLAVGDFERGVESARRALDAVDVYLESVPDDRSMLQNRAAFQGQLGHALLQIGQLDEAYSALRLYYDFSLENAARYPQEAWSRTNLLFAVDNYGGAHFELGADDGRPVAERIEHLERARELYLESARRARELVADGLLPAGTEEGIEATERSIAECEALLGELETGGL